MINLIFPPIASPTCVPLGVSFLKAYIDSVFGTNELAVQDLNICYWSYLTERRVDFSDYQNFARGKTGFFSREFYEPLQSVQLSMKEESNRQLNGVRQWLDTGVLCGDQLMLFSFLADFIFLNDGPVMFSCLFPDQLLFTLGFSRWLNNEYGTVIYIGGASTLLVNPSEMIEMAPWIDGVFTGEGELSLEIFIKNGKDANIPGFYRRQMDDIIMELPPRNPSREEVVVPDFSWADLSLYYNPVPVLPVQFSRGCKWRRCRFCAHNFSFGKYRCLDPVDAVNMLVYYRETLNTKHFYITDQYLDATFLEPFAREILKRNLVVRYTFMGRPTRDMTAKILSLLSKSGCRWISWGVESGNAQLLNLADKGTIPGNVSTVLRHSAQAGIRNQALMIFGLPGSNDKAAEDTFFFLQENQPWIHSHTASEFQLYLGTPFGKYPERYNLKVTGSSVFCRIDGQQLKSVKLDYVNSSTEDEPEMLRGPMESRKWMRLKTWVYPDNFWNALPSEHYLILCAREIDCEYPNNPFQGNRAV